MPREKDFFETIEAQARHVITLIEAEMADLEGRLAKLRDQHARWTEVLVGSPPPRDARRGRPPRRSTGEPKVRKPRSPKGTQPAPAPVDWDEVLRGLPDRFSMADIGTVTPTLAGNPRARIIAIARWSRAKVAKKVGEGVYEKVAERSRKRIRIPRPADTAVVTATAGEGDAEHVSTLSAGLGETEENPAA